MNSTTTQIAVQSSDAMPKVSTDEELSNCSQKSNHGYRLNDCQDGGWVVFDVADNTVFSGSLTDCEAWLDRAENLEGETGFLDFIRQLLGIR